MIRTYPPLADGAWWTVTCEKCRMTRWHDSEYSAQMWADHHKNHHVTRTTSRLTRLTRSLQETKP